MSLFRMAAAIVVLGIVSVRAACAGSAAEAWTGLVGETKAGNPAFAYVENDPSLPNVLIYGDSISIAYTPRVRERLSGEANVYRLHCNGGDSGSFIEKMNRMHTVMRDENLDHPWNFQWDVIYFNIGLHDLKYMADGRLDKEKGQQQIPIDAYKRNLHAIVAYLNKLAPNAQLIFATTTPVPEDSAGRIAGDAQNYNAAALDVLQRYPEIKINDLYALTQPHHAAWWSKPGNVHYNRTGVEAQGDAAADIIAEALAMRRAGEAARPNVLFIAVDDLRPELGCYGAEQIKSPRIDQLAREGLLFERAYCQMAICMPSRASIMSGYYPTRNRMYERKAMFEHVPDVLSLNQHFLNNGYETVNIGKIYHHASDEATGWSRNFRNISGPWGIRGYVEPSSLDLEKAGKQKGHRGPPFENADVDDGGYQTAAFADQAIEELRNIGDKPLFLALGIRKPHLPFNAPRKYWDLYDHDAIRLSAFPVPPKDSAEEGYTTWGELRHYYGIPKEGPLSEEMSLNLIHAYYACVSYVDAQLGRVLDEVDRLGLRDSTIVVLWADHGWKLGDYGMWCKHTDYEIDTHVPLLIRAPGMKEAGKHSDALVELVDLYPTLCDLAGIEKPAHLQGRSFAPLLDKADQPWKQAAFSIWAGNSADSESGVIGYSMRSGDYRYTEWRSTQTDEPVARELYDQSGGPLVSVNEVGNPEHEALVGRLSGLLNAWRLEHGGQNE